MLDGVLSESVYREGLDRVKSERDALTRQEDETHLKTIHDRQLAQLRPVWQTADAVEKGNVIAQVAEYFLVERVARSGRKFQPGRVLARWYDREELARLGKEPIPAEETERRTRERQKEMKRERDRRYREKRRGWRA